MNLVERVARVLAGQYYSRNAGGAAGDGSAADIVDKQWPEFEDDAIAVLKTLREPLGEGGAERDWRDEIDAALAEGGTRA